MRITNFRSFTSSTGGSRVEADVDGELLWYASDDATLAASPEAFAGAVLISAATRGEPLEIDAPIDRIWFERVPGIVRQAQQWWHLPGTQISAAEIVDVERTQSGATAQCFTCGVDSFYAFISARTPPGVLVYAHGFDIELRDRVRLDAFIGSFRQAAAAFNARSVLITTNLREHGASQGIDFRRSHGGALAAFGHLMVQEVERIVIPSSYPYHDPKPWGSHWDLDPLWSTRQVAVEHADATFRRGKKVAAIAGNKTVQRHLHVCTGFKTPTGNCSRCEKCIRTMIAFSMCGHLSDCSAFDQTVALADRIEALPILKPHLISIYEELVQGITDPQVKSPVMRLIADSRGRPKWFYQRARRWRRRIHSMRVELRKRALSRVSVTKESGADER